VLLLSVVFFSCKSKKHTVKNDPAPKQKIDKNTEELIARFSYTCKTFIAKGKAKVKTPKQDVSFNYRLIILRDSCIFLTLSKLGIEGARAVIYKDSLYAINRLEQTYYAENIKEVLAKFNLPFDYNYLERSLVAALPDNSTGMRYEVPSEGNNAVLEQLYNTVLFSWHLNEEKKYISRLKVKDQTNDASISYSNFLTQPCYSIPKSIDIEAKSKFSVQINLNHDEIEIKSEPVSVQVSIPKSYKRVRI
jgi:hypothetical protein